MWICKHCNQNFNYTRTTDKANHSRHCDLNPKRLESYTGLKIASQVRVERNLGKIQKFDVECSSCNTSFVVKERENQYPIKEQYFCSRNCANSTGGKAKAKKYHYDKVARYTTVAWRHHEKKCVICDEENIVAVHHLNEVHTDNSPENLIPLCPTHHQYMHSRYRTTIQDQVDAYIKHKWG